ncbi:hypothetical protein PR048_006284 [Dryococelus australis]|uniref:Interleukin-6 n=1 Tax=Dryococelus australis TaxID=614101 RepID=A0ABQ9IAJ1_9NEOP|nr:hypothetical protein PR048_006284 [Dryococelus australis]
MQTIRSPEFLLSVVSLNDILGLTISLYLKKSEKRLDPTLVASRIKVREIAEKLNTDLKIPRLFSLQTSRQNHPAETCEEYFRRAVYIPLLYNVITDLKDRLSTEVMNLFNLRAILPKTETKSEGEAAIREIVNIFHDLIGQCVTFITIKQEFSLWVQNWKRIFKS